MYKVYPSQMPLSGLDYSGLSQPNQSNQQQSNFGGLQSSLLSMVGNKDSSVPVDGPGNAANFSPWDLLAAIIYNGSAVKNSPTYNERTPKLQGLF